MMNLQSKLNVLLQAQDVLLKSAALSEAVRGGMYSLAQQIGDGNKLIAELMKEIASTSITTKTDDDDIPL